MVVETIRPYGGPNVGEETVRTLRGFLRGELLTSGEVGYDEARRLWNAAIDRRPAFILRAAGVSDVLAAVDFAGTHDLELAIKSGGHNVAGLAATDGGLLLDLSPMKGIRVDRRRGTVRAEAGLTWGELNKETQIFDAAVPSGKLSTTGLGGLTLAGGLGWLARAYGLTIDNLRSADVVTADGRLLTASAAEHPDLFWALRGGGGNFGVVTSFEYDTVPVSVVYGGMVVYPLAEAAKVLRYFRDFGADAPDELTMAAALATLPDGTKVAVIAPAWVGSVPAGERALAPLTAIATPLMAQLGALPYGAMLALLDPMAPAGDGHAWRSSFFRDFSDAAIETLVDGYGRKPDGPSIIILEQLGGAIARVAPEATAFTNRQTQFNLTVDAAWVDPTDGEATRAWTDEVWTEMQPHVTGAAYVGFLDDEGCGARARQLRRQLPTPGRDQASIRSEQCLPPQPEHRPGRWAGRPDPGGPPFRPSPRGPKR